jgi:alpha-L-fucosidase
MPELIRYLVRAAGANANFLLNVGPTAEGEIQPEFVERLEAMGDWLNKYGETIYATREGPIAPRSWGVTTAKGQRIYVHILSWQEPYLVLPPIAGVRSATDFETHRKLELKPVDGALLLTVPPAKADTVDRIVVLER